MPPNIDEIKESLPRDSIAYYNGVNYPPMYRVNNGFRRIGTKLLLGTAALGTIYGAYKLGQHKNSGNDKFTKVNSNTQNTVPENSNSQRTYRYPKFNYTRSGA